MKKYKPESFDKMQYFYGSVHDPLIHCLIEFNGHIDESALKRAVTLSTHTVPLIRCCFNTESNRPIWEDHGFTGEDIVYLVDNIPITEKQKLLFLASNIDISNEPQLKINILRGKEADTLCIIISHLVCDGAGFKEYLYLLGDLYTKCANNREYRLDEPASRGTRQLFRKFGMAEILSILFSKYDLSPLREQVKYALEGEENNPLFITLKITEDDFTQIKAFAKERDVSVNDLVLTAYIRALHRVTNHERITIPCPVDLRKYLKPEERHGICNLTSNFICDIEINKNDPFDDTLEQVSRQMKQQKSSDNCLKSVIMLELAFHLIPFRLMKKIFHKVFRIPVTSFTNLGVISKSMLNFNNTTIPYMYLTGAIKYSPYFQIAVSTYNDCCTLSSNLFGTTGDKANIQSFLSDVKNELLRK